MPRGTRVEFPRAVPPDFLLLATVSYTHLYSCFRTPAEAVSTVGRRIRELLDQGVDTPREFVVWKRGFLDTPLDSSEEKWVSDVAYYVAKFSSRKN